MASTCEPSTKDNQSSCQTRRRRCSSQSDGQFPSGGCCSDTLPVWSGDILRAAHFPRRGATHVPHILTGERASFSAGFLGRPRRCHSQSSGSPTAGLACSLDVGRWDPLMMSVDAAGRTRIERVRQTTTANGGSAASGWSLSACGGDARRHGEDRGKAPQRGSVRRLPLQCRN